MFVNLSSPKTMGATVKTVRSNRKACLAGSAVVLVLARNADVVFTTDSF
jgi:hypothetical protein